MVTENTASDPSCFTFTWMQLLSRLYLQPLSRRISASWRSFASLPFTVSFSAMWEQMDYPISKATGSKVETQLSTR